MGLIRFSPLVLGAPTPLRTLLCSFALLLCWQPLCQTFNLDVESPAVYSGPDGSYFGYAVDFYLVDSASVSVLIGAPKANTSQPNITEGGSVFYCPWGLGQSECHDIEFDAEGKNHKAEVKSHQWFGATVRSHGDTILACAPLYSWRTKKDVPQSDVTGTCYLSAQNFTKFAEYAPCRTEVTGHGGQGYCQGGFSADFTKDGKVVLGGPGSYFWQGTCHKTPALWKHLIIGSLLSVQHPSVTLLFQQMGSYFGYSLATTDINSDGLTDLLVGAPMFMLRGSDGRLEEVGRVYVYLQRGPLDLELSEPHLTGVDAYGRFGNTIAPLGDLNQDGFNDVAVSSPFGGEGLQGLVYIYNGHAGGLGSKPSQVITGQWAAGVIPASFGFAMRGAKDLDMNGYPDLIVGAFGVDRALLYRYGSVAADYITQHDIHHALCVCVCVADFQVELQLDSQKHQQKGGVRRALFLDSHQASLLRSLRMRRGERSCHDAKIYLRDEKEFRDKLSSIYVAMNFSLDPNAAADAHGLRPVLNYQAFCFSSCSFQAQILLDCGEDNICVPDLKLAVQGDRKEVYLGDDNSLTLMFNARNEGEGGAYEAELYVVLPPEADYSGIARNNESLAQLTCSYDTENQTRYLSCDLGNPMKSGTSLWAGLRFTVPRLKDQHNTVLRPTPLPAGLQIVPLSGYVSRPDKVFFPPANWKSTKNPVAEEDVGPAVEHVYELVNNGPSRISSTLLQLRCPLRVQGYQLLYPLEFSTEGPLNCTTNHTMNSLGLKVNTLTTRAHAPLAASRPGCTERGREGGGGGGRDGSPLAPRRLGTGTAVTGGGGGGGHGGVQSQTKFEARRQQSCHPIETS
uniref:Integrin, alpha 5 (fibronectin receptor, alpha polypeptide) n=1 Tax=Gadus morhua TaxID=8049 RepID=A0A8C5CFB7_GADMO